MQSDKLLRCACNLPLMRGVRISGNRDIMKNPERDTYLRFQIDTNRINARQNLPNMNLLEKWHNAGVIRLEMSEHSSNETL